MAFATVTPLFLMFLSSFLLQHLYRQRKRKLHRDLMGVVNDLIFLPNLPSMIYVEQLPVICKKHSTGVAPITHSRHVLYAKEKPMNIFYPTTCRCTSIFSGKIATEHTILKSIFFYSFEAAGEGYPTTHLPYLELHGTLYVCIFLKPGFTSV